MSELELYERYVDIKKKLFDRYTLDELEAFADKSWGDDIIDDVIEAGLDKADYTGETYPEGVYEYSEAAHVLFDGTDWWMFGWEIPMKLGDEDNSHHIDRKLIGKLIHSY